MERPRDMHDRETASRRPLRFVFQKFKRKEGVFASHFGLAPRGVRVVLGLCAVAVGALIFRSDVGFSARAGGCIFIAMGVLSCLQSSGLWIDPFERRWREWAGLPFLCRKRQGDLDDDAAGLRIETTGSAGNVRYLVALQWKETSRYEWVLACRMDYARAHNDMTNLAERLLLPVLDAGSRSVATSSGESGRAVRRLSLNVLSPPPQGSRVEIGDDEGDFLVLIPVERKARLGCLAPLGFAALWTLFWLLALIADLRSGNAAEVRVMAAIFFGAAGAVLAGAVAVTSAKEIRVSRETLCVSRRWMRWTLRRRCMNYRDIEEIRRFPMSMRRRDLLVVRTADRAFEFGEDVTESQTAWLEDALFQAAGLTTADGARENAEFRSGTSEG